MIKKIKEKINNILPWISQYKKIYKLYVKAHKSYLRGNDLLAHFYAYKISKRYNCYIAPSAKIGPNLFLPHPTGIVIGEGVEIGDNCTIYQNVTIGRKIYNKKEYPKIGSNVVIYCNSTVIGNISLEDNVVVGCNSVVLRNVKKGLICKGVFK